MAEGRLPLPANPLKITTLEIYRGWQEELAQLQRRWSEIQANARQERGEGMEEAEGLRLRLQALRDLIAEAVVIGGDPASWQTEVPLVRLGSVVEIEFEDGAKEDFLFVGLAGPKDEKVLTPKTPLGAAILGRRVGERVAYTVGNTAYQVVIRRCLVPGEAQRRRRPAAGRTKINLLVGEDENEEAAKVAFALLDLQNKGVSASEIVVSWRAPYQSRPLEQALAAAGIRYRLEGVEGFYDLPPIKGILALLRLLVEPTDGKALFEALHAFTPAPVEALEALAREWRGPEETPLPRPLARIKGMERVLEALRSLAPAADKLEPKAALTELARMVGRLRPDLAKEGFLSPWSALLQAASGHTGLRSFLGRTEEIATKSRRKPKDGIVLAPLDLLAGHEFQILFLTGANEGALPLLAGGQDSLPAERELFYDVLAAAETVTLSYAKTIGGRPARRSRFLGEVLGHRRVQCSS
ncbi:MAG: 3'-5' exonuclease [Bacillota bacterium]